VREAKVASEPENLIGWFRDLGFAMTRIGLEAGPLSQWLHADMRDVGLAVELLETRHVRDAFKRVRRQELKVIRSLCCSKFGKGTKYLREPRGESVTAFFAKRADISVK
jgi:transposase